jgi:hypothetical protein
LTGLGTAWRWVGAVGLSTPTDKERPSGTPALRPIPTHRKGAMNGAPGSCGCESGFGYAVAGASLAALGRGWETTASLWRVRNIITAPKTMLPMAATCAFDIV